MLPWEGVQDLGAARSQPLTSAHDEGKAGAQSSRRAPARVRHGAPGAGTPYTPLEPLYLCLSLTLKDLVWDASFPEDSVGRSLSGASELQEEAGKMLVLKVTRALATASFPLEALWEGQLAQEAYQLKIPRLAK